MTHRDQNCRCWIARKTKGGVWYSHVSVHGKTHLLSTNTLMRRAAREFSIMHLKMLLSKPTNKHASQDPQDNGRNHDGDQADLYQGRQ
jgi:hypothetical protein